MGYEGTLDACEPRASIRPAMRRSNRGWSLATVAFVAALVAACGPGATPPPVATPDPTPVITPNPHLAEPASVDEVFRLLTRAGLRITPNTASTGADGQLVKRINATYMDWPLVLSQYSSTAALRKAERFGAKVQPRQGDAPFTFAGLNILVEFGPHASNDRVPASPSPAKRDAAIALVAALDSLLGPLVQRSVTPVPLPAAVASPVAGASAAAASPVGSVAP